MYHYATDASDKDPNVSQGANGRGMGADWHRFHAVMQAGAGSVHFTQSPPQKKKKKKKKKKNIHDKPAPFTRPLFFLSRASPVYRNAYFT